MSLPVYVLLADGVEWTEVAGTTAQAPKPVRWYLRQSMPTATTQVAVLVDEVDHAERVMAEVARRAADLDGIAIDARTQQVIAPAAPVAN